jgi:ribosomal protein S18 acetylase RimI-like enzyme
MVAVEIRRFEAGDLAGVIRLCAAEGWPSFVADPARTLRILTAPGVTTVVAADGDEVVGFAEMFSDGELQAYLALLTVDARRRRSGIARRLVTEGLRLTGGERLDTLSEEGAVDFYRSLLHVESPGFRIYPAP